MRLGLMKYKEYPRDLEQPQVTAARIREIDDYYGYLAWSEVFFHENLVEKGVHVLQELIKSFPTRPEAYFTLWKHYETKKMHKESFQLATECFMRVTEYPEYSVISAINLVKSNVYLQQIPRALELLQQKHMEKPMFSVYLYQYGKICIQTNHDLYCNTGIGALREVINNCNKLRLSKCYYWLFKAYTLKNQIASAIKYLILCQKKLTSSKKQEELKSESRKFSKQIQSLQSAKLWIEDSKDEKWEKFQGICEEVKEFDKLEGEMLVAKGLCKLGKETEAIEYLLEVLPGTARPHGYFRVLRCLFNKEDYRTAGRLSKIMLKKAQNSPIQVWIKAQIMNAYCLLHNSKPGKAIMLLKCLGKTFPFLPYTSTPYLQQLRKAESIEDLSQAAERASDTSVTYQESSFQLDNCFASDYFLTLSDHKKNNKDYCNDLINEDSILTESNSSRGMRSPYVAEFFQRYRYSKEYSISSSSINSDKLAKFMKTCEQKNFAGYSISCKPKFLYLIGKFAANSSLFIDDGLWAIEDYTQVAEILGVSRCQILKALLIKGKLLVEVEDYGMAKELLNEILPEVVILGMKSKEAKIRSLLSHLTNIL